MGRMKPSWYYEKKATQANAREQYYVNKVPPVDGTTVESRGASTDLFYRSLIQRNGTDPVIYRVAVPNSTLALLTAAQAGLLTSVGASDFPLRLRGSGVKPSKVHWYAGDPTPTRQRTAWNSTWTKYYSSTGTKSHYSVPFAVATGTPTPDDLQDQFDGLFGSTGSKRGLLGASNGRAYLEFERAPVSANS